VKQRNPILRGTLKGANRDFRQSGVGETVGRGAITLTHPLVGN